MKQSTKFIIGSVVFILLFTVVAFKLQDNSLRLNASTLHEKLVQTTNDFKGLSTLVHKFGYVFTQPVVRRSTARV
jgi:hypothetical protein